MLKRTTAALLKRGGKAVAVLTAVSLLGIGATAPAQADGKDRGTGTVGAAAPGPDTNRPILKPPKPTKRDVTLKKSTFPKDNHALPPTPGQPTILTGTSREYGVGSQALTNTGMDANIYNGNPWVFFTDGPGHSLAQLAVVSDSQQQVVELGWRKATSGGNPQFFVSSWTNGVWNGYGGSFTLYAGRTYSPGDDIPAGDLGTAPNYAIQYDPTTTCGVSGTGAWWLGYKATWLGYYCEQVWPIGSGLRQGTSDFAEAFDEVAYDTTRGFYCSDVGNGHDGSGGSGAGASYFASVRFFGQATTNPPLDLSVYTVPTSPLYGRISVSKASSRTFYSGGPGSNSTNTAKGTNGAC